MLLKQYYIGIDTSAEYIKISKHRIEAAILKHKEPDIKDKEPSKHKDIDTQYFFDNI